MFAFLNSEPIHKRWGRAVFLLFVPVTFLPFLLRGRRAVIYVSQDPFWISNYLPSSLPTFFAEIVGYGYYIGTGAAALLAIVSAAYCRRGRRARVHEGPGLVWYLPAFAAGIEAMRHARLLGSRHGFTEAPTFAQLRIDWLTAAAASLSVVILCTGLGMLCAKIARDRVGPPLAVVPLLLSVTLGWCAVLSLLWPVG